MARFKRNIGFWIVLLINRARTMFAQEIRNSLIITPPLYFYNYFNSSRREISHRTIAHRTNCRIILVSIYGCMVLMQDELKQMCLCKRTSVAEAVTTVII